MNADNYGTLKEQILAAARAEMIPEAESGLWRVKKLRLGKPVSTPDPKGRIVTYPAGTFTQLFRHTTATMHLLGELVMTDAPHELNTHLDFLLRAHGRVLVSGLGLGCVVRGLLANPNVKFVVCLERDLSVLKLVAPHMPTERCSIIVCDALEWCEKNRDAFDCAWHDIWTDEENGEGHLQIAHAKLINSMVGRVKFQGAWAFPRYYRRVYSKQNVI